MGPPDSSQLIDLARTLLVVVAGLWVFYRYRRRREGRPVVRMGMAARTGAGPSGERGLFVRLHAANVSSVVLRRVDTTLALLVPSVLDHGRWRFDLVGTSRPMLPLTGEIEKERGTVEFLAGTRAFMEPGECIEPEAFLRLPEPRPDLVALRFSFVGAKAALHGRWFEWVVFALVPLDVMDERFCPLSCHVTDVREVHSTP